MSNKKDFYLERVCVVLFEVYKDTNRLVQCAWCLNDEGSEYEIKKDIHKSYANNSIDFYNIIDSYTTSIEVVKFFDSKLLDIQNSIRGLAYSDIIYQFQR